MNFDFSDEHRLVHSQTTRFLANQCGPEVVRSVLDGKEMYSQSVWKGLTDLGLVGTAIPGEFGGAGAGYLPLCLVAEGLGASLAPTPFSSTVYLAAEALLLAGSLEQKSRYLPELASGNLIGALAVAESPGQPTADSIQTSVTDGVLNGSKLVVPDGNSADIAIVVARDEPVGVSLFVTDLRHDSVRRRRVESIDPSRDTASMSFANTPATRLGDAGAGWELLTSLYDRAAVLFAFEQLGGARRALDMAVAYAKERYAFGRPIGSFQAIKHMLADMYVALSLAEANCFHAAWALSTDAPDLALAAATARVSATEAYQRCSTDNIQVHGGMGFTWESDCHLYYRRSNFLALILGGTTVWEDRLIGNLG